MMELMIAGCWLLDFTLQQLCCLVVYQVAAGKKFWTCQRHNRMFCNSRFFQDFAGFPRFSGCFNPRIWFGTTISENRKTTALKKRWNLGCLAPRPGPFSIGLVAQPFFGFPPKKWVGKSRIASPKRGPGGLDPKELLLAAVYAGDTGTQNTPNLGS